MAYAGTVTEKVTIHSFDGDASKFPDWKWAAEGYLVHMGLDYMIDPATLQLNKAAFIAATPNLAPAAATTAAPQAGAATRATAAAASAASGQSTLVPPLTPDQVYDHDNKRLFTWLQMSVKGGSAIKVIKGQALRGDGRAAWRALCTKFDDEATTIDSMVFDNILARSSEFRPTDTLSTFFDDVSELYAILPAAPSRFHIAEEVIVTRAARALPTRYNAVVLDIIQAVEAGTPTSLATLAARVRYYRQHVLKEDDTPGGASPVSNLAALQVGTTQDKSKDRDCRHCLQAGKTGAIRHKPSQCPVLKATPCRAYVETGRCRYGLRCFRLHDPAMVTNDKPNTSSGLSALSTTDGGSGQPDRLLALLTNAMEAYMSQQRYKNNDTPPSMYAVTTPHGIPDTQTTSTWAVHDAPPFASPPPSTKPRGVTWKQHPQDLGRPLSMIVDTGASRHVSNDIRCMTFVRRPQNGDHTTITGAGGEILPIRGYGHIFIRVLDDKGHHVIIHLKEVLYVPNANVKLLNPALLVDDRGGAFTQTKDKAYFSKGDKTIPLQRSNVGHYYINGTVSDCVQGYELLVTSEMDLPPPSITSPTLTAFPQLLTSPTAPDKPKDLSAATNSFKPESPPLTTDDDDTINDATSCYHAPPLATKAVDIPHTIATKTSNPISKTATRSPKQPLTSLHLDLCGPFTESYAGEKYLMVVVCETSKYVWLIPLKSKLQAADALVLLRVDLATNPIFLHPINADTPVRIQTDNDAHMAGLGGRFMSAATTQFFQLRHSIPNVSASNGLAERWIRIAQATVRELIFGMPTGPDPKMWAHAARHAAHVLNHKSGDNRLPAMQIVSGRPESSWQYQSLRFGEIALLPASVKTTTQLSVRALLGQFVNFDARNRCAKFLMKDSGYKPREAFRVTRLPLQQQLLLWNNNKSAPTDTMMADDFITSTLPGARPVPITVPLTPTDRTTDTTSSATAHDDAVVCNATQGDTPLPPTDTTLEPNRVLSADVHPTNEDGANANTGSPTADVPDANDEGVGAGVGGCGVMAVHTDADHPTVKQALASTDKHKWMAAIRSELQAYTDLGVWHVCAPEDVSKTDEIIKCKLVLKIKRGPNNEITKFKARLAMRGDQLMVPTENYSPTISYTGIRMLAAKAATQKLRIGIRDIGTSYLTAKYSGATVVLVSLDDYQCDLLQLPHGTLMTLDQAAYGLGNAGRLFNNSLHDTLTSKIGCTPTDDPCVYTFDHTDGTVYCVCYVDDITACAPTDDALKHFWAKLSTHYKLSDGQVAPGQWFLLGMHMTQHPNGDITLSHQAYIRALLSQEDVDDIRPAATPLPPNTILEPATDQHLDKQRTARFRRILGKLMHTANLIRMDIAQAVGALARFMQTPGPLHEAALRHVLRYLKKWPDITITYKADAPLALTLWADASHADCPTTRRSKTGYIAVMAGAAIEWSSKRQTTVSISTTQAEVNAYSFACKQLVYLNKLISALRIHPTLPVPLMVDCAPARQVLASRAAKASKHMAIHELYCREFVERGDIILKQTPTCAQLADFLTKALAKPQFTLLRNSIMNYTVIRDPIEHDGLEFHSSSS